MFEKITSVLWKRKYIFLFVGLFILVLTQRFLHERQNGLVNSVSSDGVGYYCYLPAAVIYQDFDYQFYYQDKNKIKPFYRPFIEPYNGRGFNKYYCGTSICLLPFFVVGIGISAIAGTEINGYTDTFLMLVSIASLVYCLLGIHLITRIGRFFSIPDGLSFVTGLVFLFATNLYHYVIQEPSMSHTYSFFAVSLFFYLWVKVIDTKKSKLLVFLFMTLALVVLIRPVNGIVVLFLPFFFENLKSFFLFVKSLLQTRFMVCILGLCLFFVLIFIQYLFYYLQTGDFYILSYKGEPFYFNHPEIWNILFSYRKGLFVYTPLIFVAILLVLLVKTSWYKKLVFLVTFMVFTYIAASWWCWWYGGSYGSRPFIDIYPIILIAVFYALNQFSVKGRRLIFAACFPFVFLNQLMAYQYTNRILDTAGMNKELYWDIFLKSDLKSIYDQKTERLLKHGKVLHSDSLNYEFITDDKNIVAGGYHSKKACVVGHTNYFSKGFGYPLRDLNIDGEFYIIAECMAKTSKDGNNLQLAISVDEDQTNVLWAFVFKSQFHEMNDGWTKLTQVVKIDSTLNNQKNYLKIFAFTDKGNNLVDNLNYRIVKVSTAN